jgi:hypothetical protein
MNLSAVNQSAHGGYVCQNKKGCDERRAMRVIEMGGDALADATMTQKESALAALTPADESVAIVGQGMRLVQPTAKEISRHQGFAEHTLNYPQPLIRVTDEDDEEIQAEPVSDETLARLNEHPKQLTHDEDFNRELLTQLLNEQGFRWVMNETLMAEGFESSLTHLMGIMCDSADDEGHLPKSGFLSILETLAKSAKLMGHKSLAFYLAEAHFNETGKRVRGF